MDSLISVIVPIYNVEDYLERCVDSIINQTYKNLEIILVDDGSQDNCPQMCDDYAKKDSRIKVVHKKNGGLSDARNAGMKVATGEYVSFIDSDDYVSLDFYETLFQTMIDNDSDIVECSIVKFYENEKFDEYSDDQMIKNFNTVDGLEELINENSFHQYVWNKLYKSSIALDIPYEVSKLNEDDFWTYQIFGRAKRVTRLNRTLYYYFQRSSSIMGNGYNIRRLDEIEGKANRQKYIEKYFPSLVVQSKLNLYATCIFSYQSVLKYMNGEDKKKASKIIRKYRKQCEPSFSEISSIKNSSKKYYYLAKLNFYICCKMKAILNIGF